MNRLCVIAVAVLAAVIGMAGIAGPAQAAGDGSVLIGRWAGFSQSSLLPAVQDSFFDITFVNNRRWMGTASLNGGSPGNVEGTLSADFTLNGTGRGGNGILPYIEFHGKLPLKREAALRPLTIHYHIKMADGSVDKGYALFIQFIGGADWRTLPVPDVRGNFRGTYTSDVFVNGDGGPLIRPADFMVGPNDLMGTGFCAEGTFFDVFMPPDPAPMDVKFEFQGTVGPAMRNGTSNYNVIGVDSHGIIAILIGLLIPADQNNGVPAVQAKYMLYDSFFDVFTELSTDESTHFDAGTFFASGLPN